MAPVALDVTKKERTLLTVETRTEGVKHMLLTLGVDISMALIKFGRPTMDSWQSNVSNKAKHVGAEGDRWDRDYSGVFACVEISESPLTDLLFGRIPQNVC